MSHSVLGGKWNISSDESCVWLKGTSLKRSEGALPQSVCLCVFFFQDAALIFHKCADKYFNVLHFNINFASFPDSRSSIAFVFSAHIFIC